MSISQEVLVNLTKCSGTGADLSNTTVPFLLPGTPGGLILTNGCYVVFEFCLQAALSQIFLNGAYTSRKFVRIPLILLVSSYDPTVSGSSGNITVNGTATYACGTTNSSTLTLSKRGLGAGNQTGTDLNTPPYAIHNG